MDKKLNAKDLINVGIFTAIYFLIVFVCGMIGYIVIFMIVYPFLIAFVGGIPFMLYLTKVNKFGMVTITGIIICFLMFACGGGWPSLAIGIPLIFLSDLVFKAGQYKKWKTTVFGYIVFSLWNMVAMLPMWIMRDSYFEMVREGYGDEYADSLMALTTGWMLPVMLVLSVAGAIVGAYFGRSVLKKHFKRAGIA